MKEKYDERQEQIANQIGTWSFRLMFGICTVVIVAEFMWKGNLELVAGETIVLVTGGAVSLAGAVKRGIWTGAEKKMTMGQNLIMSILFSVIFSAFYAVAISRRAGADAAGRAVPVFFFGVTVLGFIVLSVMGYFADRQRERQEQKYDDGK